MDRPGFHKVLKVVCIVAFASMAAACPPGSGGKGCSFSLQTLYWEHAPFVWKGQHLAPRDWQGWNVDIPVYHFLLDRVNATFVIEVGVWKGATSLEFAQWLKSKGRGVVASVDPFTGSLEHWYRNDTGYIHPGLKLPMYHGRAALYHQFWSNVKHRHLEQYVVPFPVTSSLAAGYFLKKGLQACLLHLDGAHEYKDVMEDLALWWPMIRPGGCLMGDDYSSMWPGVMKAAEEFASTQNVKLETSGVKFWLCKPSAV